MKKKIKYIIKYTIVSIIALIVAALIFAPRNSGGVTEYRLYKYYQDDHLINHFEYYKHYHITFDNNNNLYTINYQQNDASEEHVSSGTFTKTEDSYICDDIIFHIDSSKIISTSVGTDKLEFKLS